MSCNVANKVVRPIMSSDFCEARRRALGLYKAFYRFVPVLLRRFDIPKNENDCRWMIRAYFYKNACITDIRIIDVLVMKGYMELQELTENFQQKGHVMRHWNPTAEYKPVCFLEKFVAGAD